MSRTRWIYSLLLMSAVFGNTPAFGEDAAPPTGVASIPNAPIESAFKHKSQELKTKEIDKLFGVSGDGLLIESDGSGRFTLKLQIPVACIKNKNGSGSILEPTEPKNWDNADEVKKYEADSSAFSEQLEKLVKSIVRIEVKREKNHEVGFSIKTFAPLFDLSKGDCKPCSDSVGSSCVTVTSDPIDLDNRAKEAVKVGIFSGGGLIRATDFVSQQMLDDKKAKDEREAGMQNIANCISNTTEENYDENKSAVDQLLKALGADDSLKRETNKKLEIARQKDRDQKKADFKKKVAELIAETKKANSSKIREQYGKLEDLLSTLDGFAANRVVREVEYNAFRKEIVKAETDAITRASEKTRNASVAKDLFDLALEHVNTHGSDSVQAVHLADVSEAIKNSFQKAPIGDLKSMAREINERIIDSDDESMTSDDDEEDDSELAESDSDGLSSEIASIMLARGAELIKPDDEGRIAKNGFERAKAIAKAAGEFDDLSPEDTRKISEFAQVELPLAQQRFNFAMLPFQRAYTSSMKTMQVFQKNSYIACTGGNYSSGNFLGFIPYQASYQNYSKLDPSACATYQNASYELQQIQGNAYNREIEARRAADQQRYEEMTRQQQLQSGAMANPGKPGTPGLSPFDGGAPTRSSSQDQRQFLNSSSSQSLFDVISKSGGGSQIINSPTASTVLSGARSG